MGRTIEANIECPFYVKLQGCKLVCEGLPDIIKWLRVCMKRS
jgi:hypothetical protein